MTEAGIREFLAQQAEKNPDSFEAKLIELYGFEGAVQFSLLEEGKVAQVDLRYRPWASDYELRMVIWRLREAQAEALSLMYSRHWDLIDRLEKEKACLPQTHGADGGTIAS